MSEKLISFCIPSYNSENYMRKCIESILPGGEDVEIIIVNDGSKDKTGEIADEYAAKYPTICRAVHQENGGHGEGVNQGIRLGKGLYLKIVDSNDWVNEEALLTLIAKIKEHKAAGTLPELYITNFVYEHVEDNTTYVRSYKKNFKENVIATWKDMKPFHYSSTLLMHSLMYRLDVLRSSGLVLPKHTFYVDNLYAHNPLPYVKNYYYMDLNFYRYFIGRSDQSVNWDVFAKRTDQQNRVMLGMATAFHLYDIKKTDKHLFKYLKHNLAALMSVTYAFTYAKITKEKKQALKQLLKDIKAFDPKVYRFLKYRSYVCVCTYLGDWIGRKLVIYGYKRLNKKLKFST